MCGRIRAYEYRIPSAFGGFNSRGFTINEAYVTGVSLTHGGTLGSVDNPATHIWSFATGESPPGFSINYVCPCDGGSPSPNFVGEDYFCESSTNSFNDFLWDGEDCGENGDCCTRLPHPYFVKQLEQPTTDNIDLRICRVYFSSEDVLLELVEIYVE